MIDLENGIHDYIHIIKNTDESYSVYASKNGHIKFYGTYESIKEAINEAVFIQKRHRLIIVLHEKNGDVIKMIVPPLQAINVGDNVKSRRSRKRRQLPNAMYV